MALASVTVAALGLLNRIVFGLAVKAPPGAPTSKWAGLIQV